MGNSFVMIVLFGWIPVVLALFCTLPPRRAALVAFLFAWLFLPVAAIKFTTGIPAYDKMSASCVGITIAAVLFDMPRLVSLRPSWLDIPVAVWCICPFVSSVANDLGPYDGLSATFTQTVTWGMPYFIGRVYFRDAESLRELAIGIFVGGLVYVPLCLIEIRFSPQLHNWIYGYQQNSFVQNLRLGGWRPTVFMSHGLMVGMWMCMTTLVGIWLWYSKIMKRIHGMPVIYAVLALLATAVLCKSTGALMLMGVGIVVLFACHFLHNRALIFALILLAPAYMALRGSGLWDGAELTGAAQSVAGFDRADSLAFRIRNENQLAAHALQQPLFGWGGWGRNRVHDRNHVDLSITDGLWIITLGVNGIVGLAAWTLTMLLPAVAALARSPVAAWRETRAGPAVVLALVVVLYVFDCIPNAMTNPIFTLCAGALASFASARQIVTVPTLKKRALPPRRRVPVSPRLAVPLSPS